MLSEVREVYPGRFCYFDRGRMVADYRQTGENKVAFKVRCFFPNSMTEYKSCLVTTEEVAQEVCKEYADDIRTMTD